MLKKYLLKLPAYAIPKIWHTSSRVFSSSLDQNANSLYSLLNPFIDFDERIKNDKLRNSISKRELTLNLDDLSLLWMEYKKLEQDKIKLENSKMGIQEKIKSFNNPKVNEIEITGLKLAGKVIRQDIKNVLNTLHDLENMLLKKIVQLPNDLMDELYSDEITSFFTPLTNSLNHLDVGKRLDIVDYISPTTYFLKKEAADFELDITSHLTAMLSKEKFIPFSNPDFSRNLIVEGTCVKENTLLKLAKENRSDDLFLHGSASLFPFCSYHAKRITDHVPVKFVAQGRNYQTPHFEDGLYSVWQSNAVQIFIASSEAEIIEEFHKAVQLVTQIYKDIGLHFRILKTPSTELELFESLRLSFQVHSPSRGRYYEAGNLSFHSDYISKRLRMYYKGGDERSFLHVISGTVLRVPPVLASLLEYTEGCKLPEKCMY